MSASENRPVQDILREVAKDDKDVFNSACVLARLNRALGFTWDGQDVVSKVLRDCLAEVADRIDRQSVVEVTVPPNGTCHDADGTASNGNGKFSSRLIKELELHEDIDACLWPRDKDGTPCRVGDQVWYRKSNKWHSAIVNGVGPNYVFWLTDGFDAEMNYADELTHTNPRTCEDVMNDAEDPTLSAFDRRALVLEAYEMGRKEAAK